MVVNFSEEWKELEKGLGQRPLFSGTVDDFRKTFGQVGSADPPFPGEPGNVKTTDEEVKSEDGTSIKLRTYYPLNGTYGSLPVGFHAHGGGYCLGDIEMDDHFLRSLCTALPAVLVQVEYRLAPESKWPKMFEDGIAGFEWTLANIEKLGGDPQKFFAMGDSAGGGLAAALALRDRDLGRNSLKGQVLIQPNVIKRSQIPSERLDLFNSFVRVGADAAVVNDKTMEVFWDAYHPVDNKLDNYIFPYLHPSHKNLPKTFVTFNSEDVLRDDGYQYAKLLEENGVEVRTKEFIGVPHSFFVFPPLKATLEWFDAVKGGINYVLN